MESKKITSTIRFVLKGLPIIIGCMLAAVLIARKAITYVTPTYEAVARIKLDENSYGISGSNLFKDFDVFTTSNRIAAEVELLRSDAILEKVAAKLNADYSLFRVGNLKETELDADRPFQLEYDLKNDDWLDRDLKLTVTAGKQFHLEATINHELLMADGKIGEPLAIAGLILQLKALDQSSTGGNVPDINGEFRIRFHSPSRQVAMLRTGGLDVKASEKEVPIVRIAFRDASARRAAEVANLLAETYIEDNIAFKTQAAGMSLKFIDQEMDAIGSSLKTSEADLQTYRDEENVINTRQETETDLRKLAELKIQLVNIRMREVGLDSLDQYINSGPVNFQDLAPGFEAFGDLLFTELLKKIKAYEAERIDMLVKYSPESRAVKAIDAKIAESVSYIKESIRNARKDITARRASIEAAVEASELEFEGLPARDRQMVILDRNFQMNQKLYLFLMEKRMESAIQESAAMSFHRIIEYAQVPTDPISPKPGFISIVAGFLGLLIGMGLVFARSFFSQKLHSVEQLEKRSTFPVLTEVDIRKYDPSSLSDEFGGMASRLLAHGTGINLSQVALASAENGTGKSFLAHGLADALADMGRKVALLDLDFRDSKTEKGIASAIAEGSEPVPETQPNGIHLYRAGKSSLHPSGILNNTRFQSWKKDLSEEYDFVIADTSALDKAAETLTTLQSSDVLIWVTCRKISSLSSASRPDELAMQYGIGPFLHVVNSRQSSRSLFGMALELKNSVQKLSARFSSMSPAKALEQ